MKPTILAIDDDQPMLWLIAKVLEDFNVVCKSDGLDAMLWLSKGNHPDLIILDRFLSSWIDQQLEADLLELNVKKFIEKPFDPMYLVEQVTNQINTRTLVY